MEKKYSWKMIKTSSVSWLLATLAYEKPNCIQLPQSSKWSEDIHKEVDSPYTKFKYDSNPDYYFIKLYVIKQITFSNPLLSKFLYEYKNPRYMKMVLNYIFLFTALQANYNFQTLNNSCNLISVQKE